MQQVHFAHGGTHAVKLERGTATMQAVFFAEAMPAQVANADGALSVTGSVSEGGLTTAGTVVQDCNICRRLTVDRTKLERLLQDADSRIQQDYTDESWLAFIEAVKEARTVLQRADVSVDTMNGALFLLQERMDALVPMPVNKEELKAALWEGKQKEPAGYTEKTWLFFAEAIEEAERLLDSDAATQAQVDAALQALVQAAEALEPKEDASEPLTEQEVSHDDSGNDMGARRNPATGEELHMGAWWLLLAGGLVMGTFRMAAKVKG